MTCGGPPRHKRVRARRSFKTVELEEVSMQIVSALDVHRRQITYKTVDLESGQVWRGRISPGARGAVREWLGRFDGRADVHFALEGTTGWRFVGAAIERAGRRGLGGAL